MTPERTDREKVNGSEKDTGPVAYFDQAAATWDDNPRRVEMAGVVAQAMVRDVLLTADMKVMDFGCGTGLITRQLAPQVASVTAADTSAEMLAVLMQKAQAGGMRNVDTLLLEPGYPLPAGPTYDAVVSSMVFHHLEDIPHVLERFAAWLQPGGWLAIAELEPEDGSFHSDGRHVLHHGIDPSWLRSQIEALGLSVRSVQMVHTIRRQPEGADQPRDYPVFLLVARKMS